MISERFVEFLENENVGISIATRNGELSPTIGKPLDVRVSKDRKNITFYMPKVMLRNHLDNLLDNGKVALNVGAIPSHETYQFKGGYLSHHDCDAEDIEGIRRMLAKYKIGLSRFGMPDEQLSIVDKYNIEPSIGITFEVQEIFEQTPKPGTGNKIN